MSAAETPASDGRAGGEPVSPALEPQAGRVPDFFIVGHPKCGTTALYEMLRRHPQVFMPEQKEPRYFSSDLPSPYQPKPSGEPGASYADYLALFRDAAPDQLVGEASTAYIWSRTAAGLIAAAQPSARIIVVLREPADFLRSLHLQLLQHRSEEEPSLRRAIALEDERRQGRSLTEINAQWPAVLMYTDRVRYVEQLRRYHELFGQEQVLVLIYDDFRRDNEGTMRAVQRFLGIDDTLPVQAVQANPTVRRRARLDRLMASLAHGSSPLARAARRPVTLLTPRRLRRQTLGAVRGRVIYAGPKAPDPTLMLELRRRFKPEVQALSDYLGRDLVSLWGYRDIG